MGKVKKKVNSGVPWNGFLGLKRGTPIMLGPLYTFTWPHPTPNNLLSNMCISFKDGLGLKMSNRLQNLFLGVFLDYLPTHFDH